MKTNNFHFVSLFLIFNIAYACNYQQERKVENSILKFDYQKDSFQACSTLRVNTYDRLRAGKVELISEDFSRDASKRLLFEKELKRIYGLEFSPIFDTILYPNCVIPIMDSAITQKYGIGAKSRILDELNRYVDSIYNRQTNSKSDAR